MGLDMYLTRKTYVRWNHRKDEEVGYWRKANQIHAWFVENVQDGKDDCGDYYVEKEQLAQLLDRCRKVLAASEMIKSQVANGYTFKDGKQIPNLEDGEVIKDASVAEEFLPTKSGFFFGSTGYDQWYIQDIKETIAILEPIMARTEDEGDYYYHSSW
jgi:hypothetical protein